MGDLTPANDLATALCRHWPASEWREVHVLACVSAGADSMALLAALIEAKRQHGGSGRIYAGHVNHRLRGDASDGDQRWLQAECERLDVPLLVRSCDTAKLAATEGDGIEAAARSARYRAFIEMAESVGARFAAVAHTRDDSIETSLFFLLRGAGLRGLAGISFSRPLSPSVSLVRPLLHMPRSDLRECLQAIGQDFREDASNADPTFARNRLRLELLPYLREHFNSGVDRAIWRAAKHAHEAVRFLESLGSELLARCEAQPFAGEEGISLRVGPLAECSEQVLVREALRVAWRQAGFGEQAMTSEWWRRLAELARGPAHGAGLNLPGDVWAWRKGEELVMRRAPARG